MCHAPKAQETRLKTTKTSKYFIFNLIGWFRCKTLKLQQVDYLVFVRDKILLIVYAILPINYYFFNLNFDF